MLAKERLYLTADNARLVPEGDPAAATLYAIPGDEIPATAASKFALVDGTLREALLRITAISIAPLLVRGMSVVPVERLIVDGEIDEAEMLEILENDDVLVEAKATTGDWMPFPQPDKVIYHLRQRVADDIAQGRSHARVTARPADDVSVTETMTPIPPAVEPAPAAPIAATDTVAAPVAEVVGADAVAAAIEGNAPLPTPTPIAPAEPVAADVAPVLSDDAAVAAIRGDAPLSEAAATASASEAAPVEPLKEAAPPATKEQKPAGTKARQRAQAE